MRKLYALLAGFIISLVSISTANARTVTTDVANFSFTVDAPNNNVVFINTSSIGNEPGPRRAFWTFGDGSGQMTGPLQGTQHHYQVAGTYTVCLKIYRYTPNYNDSVLSAQICKTVTIETVCHADFTSIASASNPHGRYFIAQPSHNQNKKPVRVCWTFGDGRDTCIHYLTSYTGPYGVYHLYAQPGSYNACVNILYDGGCEANRCHEVQVGNPDSCRANFEKLPVAPGANPLQAAFNALPWHNNNKKPVRVCWTFGDGRDTCIQYSPSFPGPYHVSHTYANAATYEVCVNILYQGGCEAHKCDNIRIGIPDTCHANFERIPVPPTANPLHVYFRALPQHNNNRKPSRICWTFGDGRDTCINYPETYTGQYVVTHHYPHPGEYEVCVHILYYGGCEASKCSEIVIPPIQTTCAVTLFEITPSITSLVRAFLAIPSSIPPGRPERICWYFGDGRDTCIMIDPQQPLPNFTITHTYPGPGVYHACVSILFQGGCLAYNCREVVIRGAASICGGYMTDSLMSPRTFRFKGFSIHAPNDQVISYHWTFGDGSSAVGQEVTHTYSQAGNYQVCLFINTQLGCETRICRTLHVPGSNQPALYLSPNPVINVLHVDFHSMYTEQVTIRIFNSMGNQVRTYIRNVTDGSNNWTFDLSSLIPGVYSFVVQSPNQLASAIFLKL